jgi:hypothetical protein
LGHDAGHSTSQTTLDYGEFCPTEVKKWLENINNVAFSEIGPSLGVDFIAKISVPDTFPIS